jgi:aminomethyltransferase
LSRREILYHVTSRKSPLHDRHAESGAEFTDFGGWDMPISFDGIRTEHASVRESVGLFDVSHMGRLAVGGPDARELVGRLTTNDVGALEPGHAQYSCLLRTDGVVLDDIVVYDHPTEPEFVLVPNAGHDDETASRFREYAEEWSLDVTVANRTATTAMVAVQGPNAAESVDAATADQVGGLGRFEVAETAVGGADCLVARTGYTGEDGFELVFPADEAETVADAFASVHRCGLGARDTLRLEAGLLLSGQDFDPESEPRTPAEAGLSFVVDLETEFVGREAIAAEKSVDERLVGMTVEERGIARHGYPVRSDDEEVGHVTSGTMSPTLDVAIALGYVETDYATEGTAVEVVVRDRPVRATITDRRFLEAHGNS